jgi:hypothetical protein
MMMDNIKQILNETGRTISNKDRGLASMMDNEPRTEDRSPEGLIFSIESDIENLMKEYEIAVRDGDNERAQRIADIINELDAQKIGIQEKFISEEGDPMGMNLSMPNIYNYRLRKSLESGDPGVIRSEQRDIRRSAIRDMGYDQNSGMMQDDPDYANEIMQMLKGVRGNYAEGDEAKKGGPLGLGIIDAIRGGVGSAFTDPMSAQNYARNAMKSRMKQDEPTIREMFEKEFKQARMEGKEIFEFMGKMYNTKTAEEVQGMSRGGEFPDLTGDGQVTQADILKGRGVYAEGGEAIGDDLAGMAMSEEEAMAEVGNAEKEMAMIQQLVTVVQQLLAEGISEDDLVAFLKEQGLDDEDIDSLMQMVLQSQSTQAPDQIGQELQGMM